jgi:hypothetical protein
MGYFLLFIAVFRALSVLSHLEGIIVQDCLQIINNLLRGNSILVNLFRDAALIPRVLPLIELGMEWTALVLHFFPPFFPLLFFALFVILIVHTHYSKLSFS